MNLDDFWKLIGDVHSSSRGNMPRKCALLRESLAPMSLEQIRAFMDHFDGRMDEAYSWGLWGAAYVIGGGCGDDEFMDFRSTLISCGRERFESALRDPDSLAEFYLTADAFYEGFAYVALALYQDRSGQIPTRKGAHPSEQSGLEWDDEDLPKRFPKLFAKYRPGGIDRR